MKMLRFFILIILLIVRRHDGNAITKNSIDGYAASLVFLLHPALACTVIRRELGNDLDQELINSCPIVHQSLLNLLTRLSADMLSAAHKLDEMFLLPPILALAAASLRKVSGQ